MKPKIKFHHFNMEILIENGEAIFDYADLMYVECDKPLCKLYFVNEETAYSVEISLKRLLENLPQNVFFQCNRQNIINICHYKKFTAKPPVIVMNNGKKLILSQRKLVAFRKQKACLQHISPCSIENCPNRLPICRIDKT